MWIGNLMLVLLNLPLVGIWVKLLTIPYNLLYPAILAFSVIGVFSINYNIVDVFSVSAFGMFGYLHSKFDCEPAPLLLGFILGPMLEDPFRRSMILSHGDPLIFLQSPITAALLGIALLLYVSIISPTIRKKRQAAFTE